MIKESLPYLRCRVTTSPNCILRPIAIYKEHGEAYTGKEAWQYIRDYTGFDLRAYLHQE
jgi:hypothetical protein